ncbi:hypothetical protein ACFOWZ_28015 [Lentzea rhizosphaerae]|uniref:Uncharacterized protein n=1 Tax=Lentzea rhizosphaerae TaxID=2041025 RepID=A0ABV8C023_9PSEU
MEPEVPEVADLDLLIPHQMTDLEGWALAGHLLGAEAEAEPHILRALE